MNKIHIELTEDQVNTIFVCLDWAYVEVDKDPMGAKEDKARNAYIKRLQKKLVKTLAKAKTV